MATIRGHVSAERTWEVEAQLRERSAQLKPGGEGTPGRQETTARRTPLGCCHRCSAVVYTGDSLAMVAGYLVHGDCAPSAA